LRLDPLTQTLKTTKNPEIMKCTIIVSKQCKFHKKKLLKTNLSCLKHPSQTWKKSWKKRIPLAKQRLKK
jgi:hypothetical protein